MKSKLIWRTEYVKEGCLEPDKYNRWGMVGSVLLNVAEGLPHMKWSGDVNGNVLGQVAWIEQINTNGYGKFSLDETIRFRCKFTNVSDALNTGVRQQFFYASTIEEMKDKIQQAWDNNVAFMQALVTS